MTFATLLRNNKGAIIQRWLEGILATYPGDSADVLKRQKDPFANPVGHALRVGTRQIFEAVLDGMDMELIRRHLEEIIKIRAVQQFLASEAVGFVFRLKEAVRQELGEEMGNPQFLTDVSLFDEKVDCVALAAFDVFVQCREQVCELRVNEMKREVMWLVDKRNQHHVHPSLSGGSPA